MEAVTAKTRRTIAADRLWDPMIVLLVPPSVDTYNCRKTEGRKRSRHTDAGLIQVYAYRDAYEYEYAGAAGIASAGAQANH